MAFLPFFNKYPYTNFEQLNLDWLMEKVGTFDARITSNTNRIESLESRMDAAESDIDDLESRMDAAESDIDDLETRMDAAESTIDDHETRITALEGEYSDLRSDINNLDIRVTNVESDVTDIRNDITTIEGDITNIEGDITNIEGDITNIEGDITTIQNTINNLNQVEANVSDTPTATLQNIKVGDTTYNVPQGGGGSGSTVVVNPAGAAVANAEKIEVDGIIYGIPSNVTANPGSGSSDLTSIGIGGTNYNVQNLTVDTSLDNTSHNPIENKAVKDALDDIGTDITNIENDVEDISTDLTNRGSYITTSGHGNITNSSFTANLINQVIPAGVWMISVDFRTSGYSGTSAGSLGLNLRNETTSTTVRESGLKVSAGGYCSTSINYILNADVDTTLSFKANIGSSPNGTYACSAWMNAVRIK